jgi:5-methylcytosine-specific restriction protein A
MPDAPRRNPDWEAATFFAGMRTGKGIPRYAARRSTALARSGSLACEACGFDFARTYGERGHGYIECHHVEPLHVGGEGPRTIHDLALVCSNCHRMIHAELPWLTPAQLRDIIHTQAVGERS